MFATAGVKLAMRRSISSRAIRCLRSASAVAAASASAARSASVGSFFLPPVFFLFALAPPPRAARA